MLQKRPVLLAFVAFAGVASHAGATLPELEVGVSRSGRDVVVSFGYCGGGNSSSVWRIVVERRFDDGGRQTYCDLKGTGAREANTNGRWTYGAPIRGLEQLECRSLVPGKYVVSVIATGTGERPFEVKRDGAIVQGPSSCP